MRSILIRGLVMLLAFALIGGNAHARLRLKNPEQPATHTHHHLGHAGHLGEQKQSQHNGVRCCCDCLGCVSAFNLIPEFGSTAPAVFAIAIRFSVQALVLRGQAFIPEPKPPRPLPLS